MATETDVILIRGDNQEWTIRLTDANRAPLPLRSIQVRIVAKAPTADDDDDGDALYVHTATFDAAGALSNAVGIRLDGPVDDGVLTEFLTPEDITATADAYDGLRDRGARNVANWDLQVTDVMGRKKTLLFGSLLMRRDVGRG